VTDRPDCIHRLDFCPTCDGLRVTRLERLDGVESVTLDAGPFSFSGPAEVYIGPVKEPCPEAASEETP
jgi:hypothetical protein